MRHGTCFRRRLSARHAGAAPHSAVAELGVVRRRYAHPENEAIMSIADSAARPQFAEPWGAIDINHWQEVPCLVGRVATDDDVRVGRATFYLGSPSEIGAEFADIDLPHCAIRTDEHSQQIPVVIIQSERADDKHYIGFRFLDSGNGVGLRFEFQLLDAPNELFPDTRNVSVRLSASSGRGHRCQRMCAYDIYQCERRDFETGRPWAGACASTAAGGTAG